MYIFEIQLKLNSPFVRKPNLSEIDEGSRFNFATLSPLVVITTVLQEVVLYGRSLLFTENDPTQKRYKLTTEVSYFAF